MLWSALQVESLTSSPSDKPWTPGMSACLCWTRQTSCCPGDSKTTSATSSNICQMMSRWDILKSFCYDLTDRCWINVTSSAFRKNCISQTWKCYCFVLLWWWISRKTSKYEWHKSNLWLEQDRNRYMNLFSGVTMSLNVSITLLTFN